MKKISTSAGALLLGISTLASLGNLYFGIRELWQAIAVSFALGIVLLAIELSRKDSDDRESHTLSDLEWFHANSERLRESHRRHWIAIQNHVVLAYDESHQRLVEQLERLGYTEKKALIRFLDE